MQRLHGSGRPYICLWPHLMPSGQCPLYLPCTLLRVPLPLYRWVPGSLSSPILLRSMPLLNLAPPWPLSPIHATVSPLCRTCSQHLLPWCDTSLVVYISFFYSHDLVSHIDRPVGQHIPHAILRAIHMPFAPIPSDMGCAVTTAFWTVGLQIDLIHGLRSLRLLLLPILRSRILSYPSVSGLLSPW